MKSSSLLRSFRAWLRAVTLRPRFEREMDEEIRFHLQEHERVLMAGGMPPDEAHRQARIAFGGRETSRDGVRHALGLRWFDELVADLRYAARVLRNSPGFTLIAAGSLALAIGANTTIFSVAHFLLLQTLGVPHATQLRVLYRDQSENSAYHSSWGNNYRLDNGEYRSDGFTYPVYRMVQSDAHREGIEVAANKDIGTVNAGFNGTAQAVHVHLVSGNFYQQMQAVPLLGRGILPADDGAPGTGAVVVLSYSFWQSAFGGSPDVIGRVLRVDTTPVTIIGVNAKDFTGVGDAQRSPELFLPMSMIATLHGSLGRQKVLESTTLNWISLVVRKPEAITDAMLQQRLDAGFHNAQRATITPKSGETLDHISVEDGSRGFASGSRMLRKPIYVLLGLVGCVLVLACVNIANLMLARASQRAREISVRLALGAGRARVFRQLLVESLLLAVLGGAAGTLLGYAGTRSAGSLLRLPWQHTAYQVPFQWPVLAFTAGLTLLTGILFGLAPALQSTRTDVNTALKQGTQTASRQRKAWTGKGLVAFQVAMATLLVAASGLFLRTMWNLSHVQTGFQPNGLLLFDVRPGDRQYPGQKSVLLHQRLVQRFAQVPGVTGVAAADTPLIANSTWNTSLRFEGEKKESKIKRQAVNTDDVSPEFLPVLQIPVLRGRGFGTGDTTTTERVAVINQAFAAKFLPQRDPLGVRFTASTEMVDGKEVPVWLTIVGVCKDTQYSDLRTPIGPIFFTDKFQARLSGEWAWASSYIVRTNLSPADLVPALKRAASEVDPDLPLSDIRTQVQQIADVSRQERLFATLTAFFGLLALALACVGIYGVMAYTVSQRTHEIGIRLALGAERRRVRGMVLREATWLAGTGVAAGVAAALLLAQVVKSLLYQTQPRDPLSLSISAALLLTIALSAAWLPAARAARLEPMIALRQD